MKAGSGRPATLDGRELRQILGCYPTGVAVMATRDAEGNPVGLTCNSFTSVSLSPPLVLWCLALYSPNLPAFLEAPYFSINFLSAGQIELSRRFSAPVADRFEGVQHAAGTGDVPLIADCAAHLECRQETRHYAGDHVIFIGRVVNATRATHKPLVFSAGQYGSLV